MKKAVKKTAKKATTRNSPQHWAERMVRDGLVRKAGEGGLPDPSPLRM